MQGVLGYNRRKLQSGKRMAHREHKCAGRGWCDANQETEMNKQEVEMLINERARLLKVVGAAAVLVANADAKNLPDGVMEAAELLSETLNELSEETLRDALESVHAEPDEA